MIIIMKKRIPTSREFITIAILFAVLLVTTIIALTLVNDSINNEKIFDSAIAQKIVGPAYRGGGAIVGAGGGLNLIITTREGPHSPFPPGSFVGTSTLCNNDEMVRGGGFLVGGPQR